MSLLYRRGDILTIPAPAKVAFVGSDLRAIDESSASMIKSIGRAQIKKIKDNDTIIQGEPHMVDGSSTSAEEVLLAILPAYNGDNYRVCFRLFRQILDLLLIRHVGEVCFPFPKENSLHWPPGLLISALAQVAQGQEEMQISLIIDPQMEIVSKELSDYVDYYLSNFKESSPGPLAPVSLAFSRSDYAYFVPPSIRYSANLGAPAPCSTSGDQEGAWPRDIDEYPKLFGDPLLCQIRPSSGGVLLDALAKKFMGSVTDALKNKEETFSQLLTRNIKESGRSAPDIYKHAGVSRQLFSKIYNDVDYKPSKNVVLALAISLKLNIEDTEEMLQRAGYSLSKSYDFDIVVRCCISNKCYDINSVNLLLFAKTNSILI